MVGTQRTGLAVGNPRGLAAERPSFRSTASRRRQDADAPPRGPHSEPWAVRASIQDVSTDRGERCSVPVADSATVGALTVASGSPCDRSPAKHGRRDGLVKRAYPWEEEGRCGGWIAWLCDLGVRVSSVGGGQGRRRRKRIEICLARRLLCFPGTRPALSLSHSSQISEQLILDSSGETWLEPRTGTKAGPCGADGPRGRVPWRLRVLANDRPLPDFKSLPCRAGWREKLVSARRPSEDHSEIPSRRETS